MSRVPVYLKKKGLIVFFFVDDIVMMFPKGKERLWEKTHDELLANYTVKDLGELKWFLGVEVIRDRTTREMWLTQASYISTIARKFLRGRLETKSKWPKSPMPTKKLTQSTLEATEDEIAHYCALVGSILYPSFHYLETRCSILCVQDGPILSKSEFEAPCDCRAMPWIYVSHKEHVYTLLSRRTGQYSFLFDRCIIRRWCGDPKNRRRDTYLSSMAGPCRIQ